MDTKKEKLKKELLFKCLEPEDVVGVSELINRVNVETASNGYNLRNQTPEYYRWMYFNNPAGDVSAYCFKHNDKIVSSFAIAPKRFHINDEIVLGGKTMDMFTHPDYQGLGLMSKLGEAVFKAARENGIKFWFVTPSVNSYPIFLKKWKYIEGFEIKPMIKLVNIGRVAKAITKNNYIGELTDRVTNIFLSMWKLLEPEKNKLKVEHLKHFSQETDLLWNASRDKSKISTVRDSKYMNWRYFENPDDYNIIGFRDNNKLCGLIVIKITTRGHVSVGEIVDFFYLSEKKQLFKDMIWHVKKSTQKQCGILHAWVFDTSYMSNLMKEAGFNSRKKNFKILMSPSSQFPQIYDKESWFFTQGDCNDV